MLWGGMLENLRNKQHSCFSGLGDLGVLGEALAQSVGGNWWWRVEFREPFMVVEGQCHVDRTVGVVLWTLCELDSLSLRFLLLLWLLLLNVLLELLFISVVQCLSVNFYSSGTWDSVF